MLSCRLKQFTRSIALWGLYCAASTAEGEFYTVFNVPPDDPPAFYIAFDTQLNLFNGGAIGNSFTAGFANSDNVELNMTGGTIGNNFSAEGKAVVSIFGGSVGNSPRAKQNSVVNISGGTVATGCSEAAIFNCLWASDNSKVHIAGGTIGGVYSYPGSTLDLSGGSVGRFSLPGGSAIVSGGDVLNQFSMSSSSTAKISGGTFGRLDAGGTALEISGAEFKLNGELIDGLDDVGSTVQVNVPADFLLSGILADGTPLVLNRKTGVLQSDFIKDGTLTLRRMPLPPTGPANISLPSDPAPRGIRAGQTLMVADGASLPFKFTAMPDSHIVMSGGILRQSEIVGAVVDLSGGLLRDLDVFDGSIVNMTGGNITGRLMALGDNNLLNVSGGSTNSLFIDGGSRLSFSGGSIEQLKVGNGSTADISHDSSIVSLLRAVTGGTINLRSGSVGPGVSIAVDRGATINISGGSVDFYTFYAAEGSNLQLFGTQFLLEGLPLEGLQDSGDSLVLTTRGGANLTAILADGSPFQVILDHVFIDRHFFDPAATLRLTVVPEPSGTLLLAGAFLALVSCRVRRARVKLKLPVPFIYL